MAQINVNIDNDLKKQSEKILNELGLTISEATRIFFKKVVNENGIPFDLKVDYQPNEETKKALMCGEYEEVKDINDLWK